MDRITHADLKNVFRLLVKAMGKRLAESYSDVGAYGLDYAGCYGGWVVTEIVKGTHDGFGQRTPFGARRRSTREMHEVLHFALNIIDEQRKVQS